MKVENLDLGLDSVVKDSDFDLDLVVEDLDLDLNMGDRPIKVNGQSQFVDMCMLHEHHTHQYRFSHRNHAASPIKTTVFICWSYCAQFFAYVCSHLYDWDLDLDLVLNFTHLTTSLLCLEQCRILCEVK